MNLVADASGLVGELLRERGRELLQHPDIEWFVTEEVVSEVRHELQRRLLLMVSHGRLATHRADELGHSALDLLETVVGVALPDVYIPARAMAQDRIADPSDWSTVALALVMEAGVWTEDRDFFGIGLPVWNTRVLRTYLQIH